LDHHDEPMVRRIVKQASQSRYQFSSIVLGIAGSDAFRMKVKRAS
jgi:hypothetical protein